MVGVLVATTGLVPPTPAVADASGSKTADRVPTLTGGRTVEWASQFSSARTVPLPGEADAPSALCDRTDVTYECHEYRVAIERDVADGTRLRVALTSWEGAPTVDALELAVVTPRGVECRAPALTMATHNTAIGFQAPFSREAVVGKGGDGACDQPPRAGEYVIRVIATIVGQDGGGIENGGYVEDEQPVVRYRLRAALDRPNAVPGGGLLLPDLAPPTPPFGFHFGCKALDSPPSETKPEGYEGDDERVCLRYSFSYGNVGRGLLDLRFDPRSGTAGHGQAPLTQRLYHPDSTPGRYEEDQPYDLRTVGTAHLHPSHTHWHVTDYYRADLLEVGTDGQLTPVRSAAKQGLCSSPWFIVDFSRVRQDFADVPSTGCDLSQANTPSVEPVSVTLPANWADFYAGDNAPDNFVDIRGLLEPGSSQEYVLRYVLNPYAVFPDGREVIVEADVTNNTAYAHILVTRDDDGAYAVCTIDRGLGDDPWAANAAPLTVDPLVGRC